MACGDSGTGGSGGDTGGGGAGGAGGAGGGGAVERTYDAGGNVAEMVANATHLFTASGFEVRRIDLATGDSVVLTTVDDGHPSKIAIEGQDLIWMETIGDEGAVIRKVPIDAAPGTPSTLVVEDGYSTTFAVSETTIYYPLAFAIRSVPIAGGPATDFYTSDDGPGTGFHMGAFEFNRVARELVYHEGTGIFTLPESGGAPRAPIPLVHPDGITYGRLELTSDTSVAWMECEDPSQPLRFFDASTAPGFSPADGGSVLEITTVPQTNPFIQCPWMTTSSDSGLTAYFVVNQNDGMGGDEWKAYVGSNPPGGPAREFGPADAFTLGPVTKNDDFVFLAAEVGVDSLIYAYRRPL
ncbi:MAG: hypothetical protein JNL21_29345 [Myxococcales bacterium]|nr:hypothetical protein [Myxococcales bacterium]